MADSTQIVLISLLTKDKETVDNSSNLKYQLLTYQYLVLPKDPNLLRNLLEWQPAAPEQLNPQFSRNPKQTNKGHVDNAEEQDVPSASPVHGAH